jgi:S-(hydroxymethyl)glutathione dehydrogenase/alcohol dehydrogenase
MLAPVPQYAKAAILTAIDQPLEIVTLELPDLEHGQVAVDVHFSGVCRSQLMEARGGRGVDRWLPHMLGHEGSGVVRDIGPGVTRFKAGDRVVLGWLRNSGVDAKGARYRRMCGCKSWVNAGRVTTFSTATIVSESRLIPLPADVPMDVAVLFGCALPTGAGMVLNQVQAKETDCVVVVGLGGIGLSALMTLLAIGVARVIAVDVSDERLALATRLGAHAVFNSSTEGAAAAILDTTEGGADVCIESGGTVDSIEFGFSIIKASGGRLYFASHPPDGQFIRLRPHELISGKSIHGSWGGASKPQEDSERLAALYRSGRLPLEMLLGKRYALSQINEALDDLEAGRVLRPLIDLQGEEA